MSEETLSDVGLIGLAVMGQNFALNMADHGYRVSVYNRTTERTQAFVRDHPATPGGLFGAEDLEGFVQSIQPPRRIVLLVQAGAGTDAVLGELCPLLDSGDIVIDGGNALWTDTIRREKDLAARGLLFLGSGVSGGEEGARFGPSLMPGGDPAAYEQVRPVWEAIAAKVDAETGRPLLGAEPGRPVEGGVPCAAYIGPNGAGHYVKMVHNGIEYGDMQLICEAYDLLRKLLGMSAEQIGEVFAEWNEGDLDSFLVEITAEVLRQKDPVSGDAFVDRVLDAAGQKGTGKWTSMNALELGSPAATIAEAVFARCVSARVDERQAAEPVLPGPDALPSPDPQAFIPAVREALYCSKICSYAQGFQLLIDAEKEYGWNLDHAAIARIWRGGCIIRARFLQKITEAFERDPELPNLLLDPYFQEALGRGQAAWRQVVSTAIEAGVPTPSFASALAYYDSSRTTRLPQNLLQAQRDYFGAHTYERVDAPRGQFYHIDWLHPERPQVRA